MDIVIDMNFMIFKDKKQCFEGEKHTHTHTTHVYVYKNVCENHNIFLFSKTVLPAKELLFLVIAK